MGSKDQVGEVAQDGMGSAWDGFQDALVESELNAKGSDSDSPGESEEELNPSEGFPEL